MHKINTNQLAEITWSSPKRKFVGAGKEVSEALGRKPQSTDLNERHPFDVEIVRISPGRRPIRIICTARNGSFTTLFPGRVVSGTRTARRRSQPVMRSSSS